MGLGSEDANRIAAAFDELERRGPRLGRPFVDSIKGSRHRDLKEMRSIGGHLRALFAFDARRHAVVLLGGDKTGDWKGWYVRNIPRADRLYDQHLRNLGGEGPSPDRKTIRPGRDRPGAEAAEREKGGHVHAAHGRRAAARRAAPPARREPGHDRGGAGGQPAERVAHRAGGRRVPLHAGALHRCARRSPRGVEHVPEETVTVLREPEEPRTSPRTRGEPAA